MQDISHGLKHMLSRFNSLKVMLSTATFAPAIS